MPVTPTPMFIRLSIVTFRANESFAGPGFAVTTSPCSTHYEVIRRISTTTKRELNKHVLVLIARMHFSNPPSGNA